MKRGVALTLAGITMAGITSAAESGATLAAGPAPSADLLRPYTASYTVSWHGVSVGTTDFALHRESDGDWIYVSHSQPRGVFKLIPSAAMTLISRMQVDAEGVRPLQFTATRTGDTVPRAQVRFDWTAQRATGHVDEQPIDMALRPGVQDDLSVQVALIHALQLDHAPTAIAVFDKNGIRDYAYTRTGTESVQTPVGTVATVIYRSQRAHAPRSTRFWCAPQLGYLPVRVEQRREDSVEWTMELRTLQRD